MSIKVLIITLALATAAQALAQPVVISGSVEVQVKAPEGTADPNVPYSGHVVWHSIVDKSVAMIDVIIERDRSTLQQTLANSWRRQLSAPSAVITVTSALTNSEFPSKTETSARCNANVASRTASYVAYRLDCFPMMREDIKTRKDGRAQWEFSALITAPPQGSVDALLSKAIASQALVLLQAK
jgi:hypothetical protein